MEIYVVNNTPYDNYILEDHIRSIFKKFFVDANDVHFGREYYPNKYYRWHIIIAVAPDGYIRVRMTDKFINHTIKKIGYVSDENLYESALGAQDYHREAIFKISHLVELIIKEFQDQYELKDRLTKQLQNSNFGFGQLIDYVDTDIEITKQVINNMYGYKKEENNMPPKSYYKDMFTEPSQAVKDESRHKLIQSMEMILGIRDVKFNDPATIVFWDDGTKTVVKCQPGDKFDSEKGLAMAIVKKQCGHNHGYFNRIFQKWCPEPEEEKSEDETLVSFDNVIEPLKADNSEDNVETKEFTKANDGYDDITWLTRRSYDRA